MKARLPRRVVRQVRRAELAPKDRRWLYRLLEIVAESVADVAVLVALARVGVKVLTGRLDPRWLDLLVAS